MNSQQCAPLKHYSFKVYKNTKTYHREEQSWKREITFRFAYFFNGYTYKISRMNTLILLLCQNLSEIPGLSTFR